MTEQKMTHPILSWLTIIVVAGGTIAWGVLSYYSVKDADRHWDVGQLPDTPAQSVYSTVVPEQSPTPPTQLPRVPAPSTQEAKP
jgi:hypothetical protein